MSDSNASADTIRRVASSERIARHAGFWWGFAEGSVFFIVPDVYIAFAALYSLRAGAVAWLFSIAGSLSAVCLIYVIVVPLHAGAEYRDFLVRLPAISRTLLDSTASTMAADGLPYNWLLVLGGVPLKVYAAAAFTLEHSLGALLLWTLFARVVRIAPVYLLLAGVRGTFHRSIDRHALLWLLLFLVSWTAFYAFYFARMSRL